jgi:hypothetical protein
MNSTVASFLPHEYARRRSVVVACFALAVLIAPQACTLEDPSEPLFRTDLRTRVETRLDAERTTLRESIGHYGLVYEVGQEDLQRFMAQIYPNRDSDDIVMAALGGIELHGGGVLELIMTLWQPDGRPASLADAFPFSLSGGAVPLQEIYDSMRMQIYLPTTAIGPGEISDEPPASATLPRMRVRHATRGVLEEEDLDAYNALALLVRQEPDLGRTWINRAGQRVSAHDLLDRSWDHYLLPRTPEEEFADHSYLHLVEILLAYNSRLGAGERRDPNSLKQRLLSVELERREYGGYDASEALGHYVESLGFLLAESDVAWSKAEKAKVLEWLRELETVRFREIDGVPVQHLSHLLLGLRSVESNAARLH